MIDVSVAAWLLAARVGVAGKLQAGGGDDPHPDTPFIAGVLEACGATGVDTGDALAPVASMIFSADHPLNSDGRGAGAGSRAPPGAPAPSGGHWAVFAAVDANEVSVGTRKALLQLANLDYVAGATLVRNTLSCGTAWARLSCVSGAA